jgi:hypothetical protein
MQFWCVEIGLAHNFGTQQVWNGAASYPGSFTASAARFSTFSAQKCAEWYLNSDLSPKMVYELRDPNSDTVASPLATTDLPLI